jgi:hypothetical protein
MLRYDLDNENETIRNYRDRIRLNEVAALQRCCRDRVVAKPTR